MLAGNPSILRAGNTISTQAARIEPLAHGPGRDLANLRDLAGCKHLFHYRGLHSPKFGARPRRFPHPSADPCRRSDSPGSSARIPQQRGTPPPESAIVDCAPTPPPSPTYSHSSQVLSGFYVPNAGLVRGTRVVDPIPRRELTKRPPHLARGCPVQGRREVDHSLHAVADLTVKTIFRTTRRATLGWARSSSALQANPGNMGG